MIPLPACSKLETLPALSSTIRPLLPIALLAFLARLAVRLYTGEDHFWNSGYTFYWDIASNIAAGKGISLDGVTPTNFRVPLYPVFLAGLTLGYKAWLPVVVVQSAIGAATTICAAFLATHLVGPSAARTAALLTAIYPYYVIHDTALQETVLTTFLTALSIVLLLRSLDSVKAAAASGFVLGIDILIHATIAPFTLFPPLWLAWRRRWFAALCFSACVAAAVAPWALRSYLLYGSPSLSEETGLSLWDGNNPYTFSHYPWQSIDRSNRVALAAISPQDGATLAALPNDLARDNWFRHQALQYIRANPWLTVKNAFRKIGAAFSPWPNPEAGTAKGLVHALTYTPVLILGVIGLIRQRKRWRDQAPIYLLLATFLAVTAAFFAHTSHRSFLDVYMIAYASRFSFTK